jgi:hypothetical protein
MPLCLVVDIVHEIYCIVAATSYFKERICIRMGLLREVYGSTTSTYKFIEPDGVLNSISFMRNASEMARHTLLSRAHCGSEMHGTFKKSQTVESSCIAYSCLDRAVSEPFLIENNEIASA